MKQPVPKRVELQVAHTVSTIAGAGKHVVPLQQLVQYDPVKKAAQPQPQPHAGSHRKTRTLAVHEAGLPQATLAALAAMDSCEEAKAGGGLNGTQPVGGCASLSATRKRDAGCMTMPW